MLQRSALETQKLELLSKLSEVRLRAAERGLLERSPPPEPAPMPLVRPAPPRVGGYAIKRRILHSSFVCIYIIVDGRYAVSLRDYWLTLGYVKFNPPYN
jgi:hypothetical protein